MARSGSSAGDVVRIRLETDAQPAALLGEAALLAHSFQVARVGHAPTVATLADMPAANTLEIVLPAEVVRVVALRIPAARPAMVKRALPHLIEDVIIGDAAECHAVVLPGLRADGLRDVAIVDRAWMRLAQRIAQLRRPRRVVVIAEPWLAPAASAGGAVIAVEGPRGFVRHAGGVLPFSVPANGSLPVEIRVARGLLGAGPVQLAGTASMLAHAWATELGLPIENLDWTWWKAAPLDPAWSLLTDEYARGAASGTLEWRQWKLPIGMAIACVAIAIAGVNTHWWMLARERNQIVARMEQDFRNAFPRETVVVDPLRQARRLTASTTGASDDGYLAITEALAAAINPSAPIPSVLSLEYRGQVLRAKIAKGANGTAVADRLRERGYEVSTDTPGPDGAQPIVVRRKATR
ncbi:MAG TPA: type II secretion system protein GspL [Burkholderiaceae bacterium]|nr:type II secretion system protein GspL [Burkholderiaceae bacterium]